VRRHNKIMKTRILILSAHRLEENAMQTGAHEFQPTGQNSLQASSTKAPFTARMKPVGCGMTICTQRRGLHEQSKSL